MLSVTAIPVIINTVIHQLITPRFTEQRSWLAWSSESYGILWLMDLMAKDLMAKDLMAMGSYGYGMLWLMDLVAKGY